MYAIIIRYLIISSRGRPVLARGAAVSGVKGALRRVKGSVTKMDDIDEQLVLIIHRWLAKTRGQIAAGGHMCLERERILRLVDSSGRISQKQLAQQFSVSPQSMSEALSKLEHDGYIVRTKNETDKRETLVSLTEKGRSHSAEVSEERTRQAQKFFAAFTQSEKETLYSLMEKLMSSDGLFF